MKRFVPYIILVLIVCGCHTHNIATVCNPDDLEKHIGERIILTGTQTDSKLPRIFDVYVDSQFEGINVEATGVLIRIVQKTSDPFVADGNTGIWYKLINPYTGELAKAKPVKMK
jgi:hypothetical protein